MKISALTLHYDLFCFIFYLKQSVNGGEQLISTVCEHVAEQVGTG
jgi:hypothetical protein